MAYNTTPFHGKVARVEKNNVAMDFSTGWTINVTLDMAAANRQGQDWKEGLPGQAGWSGSFSGQLVLGNIEQKAFVDNLIAATPGTKLTDVKFLLDTSTNAFTGNIFITGFSTGPAVGGNVEFTFNFQGDGALAVTSAA
jgi:predicted secreted protein